MFTYAAQVIDTTNQLHTLRIEAKSYQGVKAQARRIAKAQGINVKYVESVFVTSAA